MKSMLYLLVLALALISGCTIAVDPCQNGDCNAQIVISCVQLVLPTGIITECTDGSAPGEASDDAGDSEPTATQTMSLGGGPESCLGGCCPWMENCILETPKPR